MAKQSSFGFGGLVPGKIFFTKGVGVHREKLQSFEYALRDAGIEKYNLVRVSSIFPPHCKIVGRSQGLKELAAGQLLFVVIAENSTNEPGRLIASAIGLAVPADRTGHGYLSEHHSFGETDEKAGDYSEDLAATMLASTLGIAFDSDTAYDERKEVYLLSGKIITTRNVTQSARGNKAGRWTSVVAAAAFIL